MSEPSQWPLSDQAIRYVTPGFMREYFSDNRLTRACFPTAVGYYPKAADHAMQRDSHDDDLIIYCAEGSGTITTSGFSGYVNPGDLLLLPSGTQHSYQASDSDPWTIYWFHFSGLESDSLMDSLMQVASSPVVHLGPQPLLIGDFTRLLKLRDSGFQFSVYQYSASLVRQILCYLAVEITNTAAIAEHNFNLDKIQQLMREHLETRVDLDTLASSAQLSRYHFSCKYKQLTGYPPIQHFIRMKMEYACQLLDNSDHSIGAVGRRLGYDDPLYFSRQFRKVLGISPKTYRQATPDA